MKRIVAYASGCIVCVLALVVYLSYVFMRGFPDGFISERALAERSLASVFVGISAVIGAYCVYLGRQASRIDIGNRLSGALIVYFAVVVAAALIDFGYRVQLMHGGGG